MTAAVRTACILAAGRGARLGERGRAIPKGFLRLGPDPIIVESLDRLGRAGVERVVLVTGHQREHYEELARERPELELVHNERFANSGSMVSLVCARERLEEDFLLLESDLIYEERALTALLEAPAPDGLLVSGFTGAGDEVWVETDGKGDLVGLSKDRASLGERVVGELVGVTRVSRTLLGAMLDAAEPLLAATLFVDYETDALVAAARSHPVPTVRIEDLRWAEIDDERALERARNEVYPGLGRGPR